MSLTNLTSAFHNKRLEELSLKLENQKWIEFEFGTFEFWQLKKALMGQKVQLVTGSIQHSVSMDQMEEMDSETLEFSILFCKNRLRKTLVKIDENNNEDQRKSLIKEISEELQILRKELSSNILLLEHVSETK
tara:strand:- start:93 stop:491 length:399 start_codon:yes stop_codon:yes gene_type:complete